MKNNKGDMVKRDEYRSRMHQITGNPALSRIEMNAGLSDLLDELIVEEKPKKEHHWPGMYPKIPYFLHTLPNGIMKVTDDHANGKTYLQAYRAAGTSCKTEAEVRFVQSRNKAKLAVIDRLKELNEGCLLGGINHYEVRLDRHNDCIQTVRCIDFQVLPDCFHSKTEEIWQQVIEEFGEKKINLAIWPKYEEKA